MKKTKTPKTKKAPQKLTEEKVENMTMDALFGMMGKLHDEIWDLSGRNAGIYPEIVVLRLIASGIVRAGHSIKDLESMFEDAKEFARSDEGQYVCNDCRAEHHEKHHKGKKILKAGVVKQ